jgi:hypothetical protein
LADFQIQVTDLYQRFSFARNFANALQPLQLLLIGGQSSCEVALLIMSLGDIIPDSNLKLLGIFGALL